MSRVVLDPTGERTVTTRELLARPASLDGQVIALLDITKPRGNVFLDRLDARLSDKGISVKRYRKPTFTRVAPVELAQKIAVECDVVIEGLAD